MSCWLPVHEANCGHVLFRNEMWVERMIQTMKPRTRVVFAKNAEVSITKKISGEQDMRDIKLKVPGAASVAELRVLERTTDFGPEMDVSGQFMLLHKGKHPTSEQREQIIAGMRQLVENQVIEVGGGVSLDDWLAASETWEQVWVHRSALIQGNEHINATENTMERTRSSSIVQVRYILANKTEEEAQEGSSKAKRQRTDGSEKRGARREETVEIANMEQKYVAVTKYFVRLPAFEDGKECTRLAICDYYCYMDPIRDPDTGDVLQALHYTKDKKKTFEDIAFATLLSSIDTKLVAFWRPDHVDANLWRMYFTTNPGSSGHVA